MFTNTPILSLVLNIGDLSPNSLSQLLRHSGAAPIGQYFCNRRWLAAAAATLLTRFSWERRKGGNSVDVDYRFVVGEIEYLPLLWMPVSSAYTSALHKEMADVVMDLSNICRPEYVRESIWTAWDVPWVFITWRLFRFVEEKNRDLDPLRMVSLRSLIDCNNGVGTVFKLPWLNTPGLRWSEGHLSRLLRRQNTENCLG